MLEDRAAESVMTPRTVVFSLRGSQTVDEVRNLGDVRWLATEDRAAGKLLLAIGERPRDASLDVSEHAAMTIVASLILNLDETITKE